VVRARGRVIAAVNFLHALMGSLRGAQRRGNLAAYSEAFVSQRGGAPAP
jgi:hypothetical protein